MPDFMSPEKRSHVMSCIRSSNTKIEQCVGSMMHRAGLRYRKYVKSLPGKPDFVFSSLGLVIFVDGDFWHGWRFPQWEHKLSPYWKNKIGNRRKRDRRIFAQLRKEGWTVLRIWEHQIKRDPEGVLQRILQVVAERKAAVAKPVSAADSQRESFAVEDSGASEPGDA